MKEQYVCTVCGYNMVGYHPGRCPFCGATREKFLTSEDCSARFRVESFPVNERVTRLNSVPPLGIEHAAYRIETDNKTVMVDCPSSFDKNLSPVDAITFTHHHFLGASNQYRDLFSAQVAIHHLDSAHPLCKGFTFDITFSENFVDNDIEAFHIGGHTPGFTFYIFDVTLLICDYTFLKGDDLVFNPYGPKADTKEGGKKLKAITEGRKLASVCGYNFAIDYDEWQSRFNRLLAEA